jgi:hypothetical protein
MRPAYADLAVRARLMASTNRVLVLSKGGAVSLVGTVRQIVQVATVFVVAPLYSGALDRAAPATGERVARHKRVLSIAATATDLAYGLVGKR